MSEPQVELLCKAASIVTRLKSNPTQNLLRSYYLMRCRVSTKGYGLPEKYFSSKVRCPHCFLEWDPCTEVKVQPIIHSQKQRRRIRQSKISNNNKDYAQSHTDLLRSNKIELICTFCHKVTTTTSLKPEKFETYRVIPSTKKEQCLLEKKVTLNIATQKAKTNVTKNEINLKQTTKKVLEVNIYSKTKDVFSLTNNKNSLQKIANEQKVIMNNKKKKDKFAGLCKQAVLASAKLKEEKKKHNKLDLFLKPSNL